MHTNNLYVCVIVVEEKAFIAIMFFHPLWTICAKLMIRLAKVFEP